MNDTYISAQELREKNPRILPEQAASFSKSSFWYYTRLSTADKILNSHFFRVSNLSGMNDVDEMQLHEEEQEHVFVLCFCNSNTEKIPMWYLYSGIAGNGAALGLTPSRMISFIQSIRTVRAVHGNEAPVELEAGTDFELQYGWVYYQKKGSHGEVLYRNKWYAVSDSRLFEKGNFFLKAYPWEYEKEFRIIFINRTDCKYDALFVDIPEEICTAIKVKLAPELNEKKFIQIKGLNRIGIDPQYMPQYSNLSINMNLFHRNRKSFPDYLRTEFSKESPDIEPAELCKMICDAEKCRQDKLLAERNKPE